MKMFEDLVDDGASYPCSFYFLGYGEAHRCERSATTAITQEALERLQLPKLIMLAARALCQSHSVMISEYVA